jgi:hypothetical protein
MSEEDEDINDREYWYEGECTCDHAEEKHSWMGCTVKDCPCEMHLTY